MAICGAAHVNEKAALWLKRDPPLLPGQFVDQALEEVPEGLGHARLILNLLYVPPPPSLVSL